ncbi:MAG: hypothetical protein RL215_1623 [Planctomycetota bacterium]
MSTPQPSSTRAVRRLATLTCLVALLPIGMGALTTTMKAGMAFADWPSSDGQNMLLYPWFRDFRNSPDKFVEHGHRLAGVLIGCVAIALAVCGWRTGKGWIRNYSIALLVAVIAQGLLGGARVLMNAQTMAMTHSLTGALFFASCAAFRLLLVQQWPDWLRVSDSSLSLGSFAVIVAMPAVILAQYALGGALRHLHVLRTEHALGAVVVLVICSFVAVKLLLTSHPLLRMAGGLLLCTLLLQFALGLGAMMTRFGYREIGYVAVFGSLEQAIVCSLHTVAGMFLFASGCIGSLSTLRLYSAGCLKAVSADIAGQTVPAAGRAL